MSRIAIFLPDLRGGGAERVNLDLAREFVRRGHTVEFVLMRARGDFLPEAQREFAVVDLAAERVRNAIWPLIRYLKRRRPEAVIAAMWPLTVVAPIAARIAGYRGKVLVSEHSMLSLQYRTWGGIQKLALRASTFVGYRLSSVRVGVSDGVCSDIAGLSRMTLDGFVTIYNPIPAAAFPAEDALQLAASLWRGGGPRILTVGNLKPVKNQALLLRAFARLVHPGARLMILGQGQNEAMLRDLAADLGIADRVVFAGFHADPSPFYATADLFALSSDYEGFGNVIVEALSFGLPVVSTACPSGPREILEDGKYGTLVPVGDVDALARAMQEALSRPHDREALKRRAQAFSVDSAADAYLDLLLPEWRERREAS